MRYGGLLLCVMIAETEMMRKCYGNSQAGL